MTIETCKKLLEHYENIGNEVDAQIMRDRIELKSKKDNSAEPEEKETKSKKKK